MARVDKLTFISGGHFSVACGLPRQVGKSKIEISALILIAKYVTRSFFPWD